MKKGFILIIVGIVAIIFASTCSNAFAEDMSSNGALVTNANYLTIFNEGGSIAQSSIKLDTNGWVRSDNNTIACRIVGYSVVSYANLNVSLEFATIVNDTITYCTSSNVSIDLSESANKKKPGLEYSENITGFVYNADRQVYSAIVGLHIVYQGDITESEVPLDCSATDLMYYYSQATIDNAPMQVKPIDSLNWEEMSDEDIQLIIEKANAELAQRKHNSLDIETDNEKQYLVCDFYGMTIMASNLREGKDKSGNRKLIVSLYVENNSSKYDYELFIAQGRYSINGWETKGSQTWENLLSDFYISKGNKCRRDIELDFESAGINSIDQIENIRFSFEVHIEELKGEKYSDPITINLIENNNLPQPDHKGSIQNNIDSTSSYDNTYSQDESTINSNHHRCQAGGCSKEGIYSIQGITGQTEYYCYEHLKEMEALIDKIIGE